MNKEKIREMSVGELMTISEDVGIVLSSYHIGGCKSCSVSDTHKIKDICIDYGIDEDSLIYSIMNVINPNQEEEEEEIKVNVTFGKILDHGDWDYFCEKYGINPWCINEGLADRKEQYSISVEDAKKMGLI